MAEQPITAHFALKRLYSELNGHATEITDGAGRRTENSCNQTETILKNIAFKL
jgi:hypothetical protein